VLCVPQTLKLNVLLLPALLVICIAAILVLAVIDGQMTSDDVVDVILPQPQALRTPHPVLVGLGGEPLQLADGQTLGVVPNPADGGKTLALVSYGRPVCGRDQKALTFNLGGPKGRTLVDDAGAILLGSGGLPLDVSGTLVAFTPHYIVTTLSHPLHHSHHNTTCTNSTKQVPCLYALSSIMGTLLLWG
jgi:hypothetical protein